MQRLREHLSGSGKVFAGEEFIANVEYSVRVYDTYQGYMPTVGVIQCRISGYLLPFGRDLTLHLSDGRKLDFAVRSSTADWHDVSGYFY